MENTPANAKLGEASSQVSSIHAAGPLNEEGLSLSPVEEKVLKNEEVDAFSRPLKGSFRHKGQAEGSRSPSFSRLPRPRTSHESIKLQAGATITSQFVPGQTTVVVRQRTSTPQTNPQDPNNQVPMEGDEEIVEEEAVCKFCFKMLKDENILKTECRCGKAFIHEECATRIGSNNCDSCGQEVHNFPVTLLRGLSFAQRVDVQQSNKQSLFSRFIRMWKC